jgi:hypothetical protein
MNETLIYLHRNRKAKPHSKDLCAKCPVRLSEIKEVDNPCYSDVKGFSQGIVDLPIFDIMCRETPYSHGFDFPYPFNALLSSPTQTIIHNARENPALSADFITGFPQSPSTVVEGTLQERVGDLWAYKSSARVQSAGA